jgi:hypothetical protein
MCDVPDIGVCCCESIIYFLIWLRGLSFFSISVTPIITGVIVRFKFQISCTFYYYYYYYYVINCKSEAEVGCRYFGLLLECNEKTYGYYFPIHCCLIA